MHVFPIFGSKDQIVGYLQLYLSEADMGQDSVLPVSLPKMCCQLRKVLSLKFSINQEAQR